MSQARKTAKRKPAKRKAPKRKKPAKKAPKRKAPKKPARRKTPKKAVRKISKKPIAVRSDSTLTPETIRDVCRIVRQGNFRTHAFARIGIQVARWTKWIALGRRELKEAAEGSIDDDEITLRAVLVIKLERAEAEVACQIGRDVLTAKTEDGRPDVKFRAWWLERRFGKLFSRNPSAIVDGEIDSGDQAARGRDILLARMQRSLGRGLEDEGEG